MRWEKHHILHHRLQHEATKDNKWLRCKAVGMIAILDEDTHDELHRNCPPVPPLDIFTAQRTRNLYIPDPNPLKAIQSLCMAIEGAMKSPKSHYIEREVAKLTIEAVQLQLPYIRYGMNYGDT